MDELLKPSKIQILSDIQVKQPDVKIPSDNETVHSAQEDPILDIPITENCINNYSNQIIFTLKPNGHYHVITTKPFGIKTRHTVILTINYVQEIIKFFKDYVDPKKLYAIYTKDAKENLYLEVSTILPSVFRHNAYKLVISKSYLYDVCDETRQKDIIKYHHNKTCHRGINEALLGIKQQYYWPKMKEDLTEFINNCDTCQQTKYDRNPPKIKFNLSPTPTEPLELIHLDTFQIHNVKFLTLIDVFSRYGQAYVLEPICTATTVMDNLLTFINHHGLPYQITCDNGTEFKSTLLLEFCKLHNIAIHFTTPGNPNSNSPVERFHSTIIEHYRALKIKDPNAKPKQLMQYAILGYNLSVHSVTKQKPFDIINGKLNALDPFDLTDEIIVNKYIDDRRERLKIIYKNIYKRNLETKTKIIDKNNENREEPIEYNIEKSAYTKNPKAERSKDQPRYEKISIKDDIGKKIITSKDKVIHKSRLKKPKKFSYSQGQNEDNTAVASTSHAANTNLSDSDE